MTQFYSRNDVKYNGDVYSIPFSYMKEEEIQVYIDDILFIDWYFLNESQLRLRTTPVEVTSETIISVRRVTNIDDKVVTYTNNTLLNKENLNLSQDQLLHAVQELYDNNAQFEVDIKADVDEKVERVSDAVEKLEFLEESVEIAGNAALVATEQAQIATEKAEETAVRHEQALKDIEETVGDIKVLTTLKIGQIGIAPLGIDETLNMERYLNGQIIIQDQFKGFTKYLKRRVELYPSIACLEDEWQTIVTMSAFSQCGKFVIDDNAGTIRLPKVVNIQGLTDLSKLGEIVEAGLPNISGSIDGSVSGETPIWKDSGTGALYNEYTSASYKALTASTGNIERSATTLLNFDASKSNPIYGNSNTVQQEQIQYPYFIQVATGAETEDNIINEIELNNPFSFGDSKYSPVALNNLSWLKSEGQWNAKAVYPAYYEWLLKIYNGVEVVDGVSVKLTTEEYTDYDWVLNTADETFRLPLLDGSEDLPSEKYIDLGTIPNGGSYTPPANGFIQIAGTGDSGTFVSVYLLGQYGNKAYSSASKAAIFTSLQVSKGVPVTFSYTASLSRIIFTYAQGNGSLYYYVGETVQNANLINAGRIEETLVKKVDMQQATIASFPSDRYIDLTLGASGTTYTAPANGYFYLNKTKAGQTQYIALKNITGNIGVWSNGNPQATNGLVYTYIPAKKGDIVETVYSTSGTTNEFRFIYAQGEVI